MGKEVKFLRLDADEVALVVTAFNHSRVSMFAEEDRPRLKDLVRQLGRFTVATPGELREDYEHRGRPPGRPPSAAPTTATSADFLEEATASLRGARR